jgi:branched-chain amino acid transport system permease protein
MGGLGTIVGPLLGALVLESLQQDITLHSGASQAYLIVYGALFLAVVLILPRGVIPSVAELIARRRARSLAVPGGPGSGEPDRAPDSVKPAGVT